MEVEETTPERYDIPGVYYASPQEVTGAVDAPLTAKAGSIYVGKNSTFTFSQGAIRSHSAEYGGAIYVANGGTFTMTGGVIAYNQAKWGGAIYVEAGGTCNLLGGSITGNASEEATAVYVEDGGTLVVDGCNIVNNYTQLYGNYIDFYVDGVLNRSVSLGQNGTTFNLADAPLTYEQCNGYFSDETLMTGVEDGASLGTVVQSAVATGEPGQIYSLYTRTATPSKLTFTLNSGNEDYNVKQIGGGVTTGVVVIPRQYNGKDVTSIFSASSSTQGAFYNNYGITAVYLPNTLASIGFCAFFKDSSGATLKTVTIPYGVTNIAAGAFWNCSGLTSITIPDSVTSIGGSAFSGCTNLNYNEYDNANYLGNSTNPYVVLMQTKNTSITSFTININTRVIYDSAFRNCTGLTSITIPDSVTSIGSDVFYGCSGLENITVDNNNSVYDSRDNCNAIIRKLDNTLIEGCKTSTIPDSVTSIGNYAFYGCSSLTSVVIPNSITSIGRFAFSGCSGLTGALTIPDSVTSIGSYAFYGCSSLTSITIPDSVTSIGESAFSGCSGLTGALTIPSSVTSIGVGAFQGCTSLTEINYNANINSTHSLFDRAGQSASGIALTIGNNVTTIPSYLFHGSSSANAPKLISVDFGTGVTSIGSYAFYGCSSLTSITIPDSVTSIGSSAFRNCTGLTSVTFINPNGWETGGTLVSGSDLADPVKAANYINTASTVLSMSFDNYLTFTPNDASNPTSYSVGAKSGVNIVGNLVIPSTYNNLPVTSIGDNAFSSCAGLTSVTIPNSVTSIVRYAFAYCSGLTSLSIPDNVTSIGNAAFRTCTSLTSVTIGSGVTNIGNEAFLWCTNITSINYNAINASITSYSNAFYNVGTAGSGIMVTIGDDVTTVPSYLFKADISPKINGLIIGNGTTSIGTYAFYGCSTLESAIFKNINGWKIGGTLVSGSDLADPVKAANYIKTEEGRWSMSPNNYLTFTPNDASNPTSYSVSAKSGVNIVGNLVIPSTYNNLPVTSIGDYAFKNSTGLTSVTIPNNVTSIGYAAFQDCAGLTGQLTLPNSLVTITDYAFANCTGLTGALVIPDNVTSVGGCAFQYCRGFTSVYFGSGVRTIKSGAFYGCSGFIGGLNLPYGLQTIGESAFYNCTGITSLTISESVTSIGRYAFTNLSNITRLTIPESVTNVGENAFRSLSNLEEINYNANISTVLTSSSNIFFQAGKSGNGITVTIGNNVTAIPAYLFYGLGIDAPKITKIIIPNSVGEIGECAFNYSTGLTEFIVDANNLSYASQDGVLYNNAKTSIIQVPKGITGSVTLPNTLVSIGESAFNGCAGLTNVTIGSGVISIGQSAFAGCDGLREFIVDNNNTTYASQDGVLYNKAKTSIIQVPRAITGSVTLPNTLTSIGSSAFAYCAGLTSVVIGDGVSRIGDNAFDGCLNLCRIEIGNGIENIGKYSIRPKEDGTGPHIDIIYAKSLTDWLNINFSNYWIISNWTLYINNTAVTNLTIPNAITEIPDWAFYFNSSLTSVTMADSVTSVGIRAFARCSNLETVTIGAGVQTIGDRAFNDCTSLEKIYIPSTVVTIINAAGTSAKGILAESSMTAYIYTDLASAANKPAGWDTYFNYYDANIQLTVNYNVTKQQFDEL